MAWLGEIPLEIYITAFGVVMEHPLKVGSCLLDEFKKQPNQIIKVERRHDRWWYYIRSFEDGHLTIIPEGYIPYSYSVVDCPVAKIPPPPPIKVGDYVEWDKTRGIVKAIKPDGEVELETEREILGVKGIAFPDVYELHLVKRKEPAIELKPESVVDYDRRFSLGELRQMCKEKGLGTSGDKKTLARRLIAWQSK